MPGFVVLLVVSAWTAWLLYRDVKERDSVSGGVWIVVAWAVLYGSRPVTSWFMGADPGTISPESHDEGTPSEAVVHLALILAGLTVVLRRGVRFADVISDNRWVFAFYLFWIMSVVWSEMPFVTAKRLFKDLGNVVMVLVILTARQPGETVKAALVRCAYLCIPLSIVLIRYYPDLGRAYAGYGRSDVMLVGVTTHKNALGTLAMVSALCLLWDLLSPPGQWRRQPGRPSFVGRTLVLLMCWHLLLTIDSATSMVCAVLGSALLIAFSTPMVQRNPSRFEAYGFAGALGIWLFDWTFGIREAFLASLGRDASLTTRTDIWPIVLKYQDSPLIGAGFNTFWSGKRLAQLWEYELVEGIIQAHSGYVETYLNGGVIGVGLLALLLVASYGRIRRDLGTGTGEAALRYVVLLVAVVYNGSEASFNKLSILWFLTVFALMSYRTLPSSKQTAPAARQSWPAEGARRI
jgi:O-antigen ligase